MYQGSFCSVWFVCLSYPMAILHVQRSIGVLFLLFDVLEGGFVTVVKHDLLVDQVFEVLFAQRILFKIEVESTHWLGHGLIVWEMQLLQVRVLEGIRHGNPLSWVICQHLFEQVDGLWIGALEKVLKLLALSLWELEDKLFVFLIFNLVNQLWGRITQKLGDHIELLFL